MSAIRKSAAIAAMLAMAGMASQALSQSAADEETAQGDVSVTIYNNNLALVQFRNGQFEPAIQNFMAASVCAWYSA